MPVRIENSLEIHGQVFLEGVADGANRHARNFALQRGRENVSRLHLDDTSLPAQIFLLFRGSYNLLGSERDVSRFCPRRNSEIEKKRVARGRVVLPDRLCCPRE